MSTDTDRELLELAAKASDLLSSYLDDGGHHTEAHNVRNAIDLESYENEMRLIDWMLRHCVRRSADRGSVPPKLIDLSIAATPGAWHSMREGNQFIDTRYMPTMKCVGASRIDGPKRPWNPHALIAFGFKPEEYEKVRMTDADADFVCALVNWFRSLAAAEIGRAMP